MKTQRNNGLQWQVHWAIWSCRNAKAYASKTPTDSDFRRFLASISFESVLLALKRVNMAPNSDSIHNTPAQSDVFCYMDGSWVQLWEDSIEFICKRGDLLVYKSAKVDASCPLQVEAVTLRDAIHHCLSMGISSCTFNTDSLTIATSCTKLEPPLELDWRAFRDVYDIWKLLKVNTGFRCVHISRSYTEVANDLAQRGRTQSWNCLGYTSYVLRGSFATFTSKRSCTSKESWGR